jgi:ADP-heptose:LPS heptosyltransferase/glycosyltransferase involved in cell wall biosynthesis/tetratricopeptide (TPR) repeat protein
MVLLGRMPATAEYHLVGEPLALLRRLASSAEFFETVIAPLGRGAPLPQQRQHPAPPAWMVEWLIGILHPPYATSLILRHARGWDTLVAGLVRNPATANRLMSEAHRREALALLGDRAPSPAMPPPPTAEVLTALEAELAPLPLRNLEAAAKRLDHLIRIKRTQRLLKDGKWEEVAQMPRPTSPQAPQDATLLTLIGRALLHLGRLAEAADMLSNIARAHPADAMAQLHAAIALRQLGDTTQATALEQRALALRPRSGEFLHDYAGATRRRALRPGLAPAERQALLRESIAHWREAAAVEPARGETSSRRIVQALLDLGAFEEAQQEVDHLFLRLPGQLDVLILRSQVCLARNQVAEAMAMAEEALRLDPAHQGARYQLRSLRPLLEEAAAQGQDSMALLVLDPVASSVRGQAFSLGPTGLEAHPAITLPAGRPAATMLGQLEAEWVLLAGPASTPAISPALLRQIRESGVAWCGRLILADEQARTLILWRRELLLGLHESGLLSSLSALAAELARYADVVSTHQPGATPAAPLLSPAASAASPGLAVLMSRHGIVKFGGGEHFLDSIAGHYQEMGYEPLILGTRPDQQGRSGVEDGRPFHFLPGRPAELRRFFLERRPAIVHVLSGLGYEVAAALDYLDIPFVYGLHFWRDALGAFEGDGRFFEQGDSRPVPRPGFRAIIQRAAAVYSNSAYTQAVLEEAFQLRTPIIHSLPREVEQTSQPAQGDAVLLLNAKPEKGFDLLLEVARRCPDVPFQAVASQSDAAEAQALVAARGLRNVAILPRTDDVAALYRQAKLVAVPSYRFVETFSRVCIEAQRFGKPVLGSDKGNVPYLLRDSGVILPDDAEAWAAEIRRIYHDPAYYRELVARAGENSRRYAYDGQRQAVRGLVSGLRQPVLVGVGSGIGNMLHVGPMIRNIARRLGSRIDLVVAEDHQDSLFLLQNSEYVNTVFSLRQSVLRRRYDVAFLTHSFGAARLPFQARRTLYSRDWMPFEPGGPFHETVFNLEAASHLLGIPYDEADITGYSVADYRYRRPPGGRRIGIHGGSKGGFWLSKRWPEYTRLCRALERLGFEVASFGIPEEHVEGTLDLTGGSIAEMTERMMTCSYFITNDSGLMNIANALGIPMTALFGPTNPATRGPLGAASSWLGLRKDCAPCEVTPGGRKIFQAGECRCIAELKYERVEQHILTELKKYELLQ